MSESLQFDVRDAAAPCTPSGASTDGASLGDAILAGRRKKGDDSPSDAENVGGKILFLSVVTFATMGMLILVLLKILVQLLSALDLYKL